MKKIFALVASLAIVSNPTFAGGLLTNTNQSISFLRNPAREASIGIDGVYSNPAGVAFLKDGWHVGLNWQCAVQTRTVETTNPYLDHTLSAFDENGNYIPGSKGKTKRYRGHATAPVIPSLSAAYNRDKFSFQFHFAVAGGGGKCQYENGLGSFEGAVGNIASQLKALGVKGYGVDGYLEGKQYYFGVTLGTAYKVTDNLSVYGGLRGLIGSANYSAQLQNIQVATSDGLHYLSDFITGTASTLATKEAACDAAINLTKDVYNAYGANYDTYKAAADAGNAQAKQIVTAIEGYQAAMAGKAQIAAGKAGLAQLEPYRNGVDLQSDQSSFGIAPIIGVDYKIWRLNLAAKYEFRTKMSLKNNSNLKSSSIPATAQYVDGTSIREDVPALLALGVQYSPVDIVRVNLGYHHFYDKESKKYDDRQKLLSGGTNEYLGGIEVDCTDRLVVSSGVQVTRYGNTDEFMSDASFVTDSWSLGFGASYQANPNVKIEAAYFKTFYSDYNTAVGAIGQQGSFSRTNDVIGVGLVMNF